MKNLLKTKKSVLICIIALWNAVTPIHADTHIKTMSHDSFPIWCDLYHNEITCVRENEQLGYINSEGHLLFPFAKNYKLIKVVDKDKWFVHFNKLSGAVNKAGDIILPFKYFFIRKLSPHFFAGSYEKNGRTFDDIIVYKNGRLTVKKSCHRFGAMYGEKIGLCSHSEPDENRANSDNSWSVFVDSEGNQAQTKYEEIKKVKGKEWFIVNTYLNNRKGIVDYARKAIIPAQFNDIKVLDNGSIAYKNERGYWGLLDKLGNLIIEAQYDEIDGIDFYKKFMKFRLDGRFGLIDITGKEVIPPKCDSFSSSDNGLLRCMDNVFYYPTLNFQPITLSDYDSREELVGDRILFKNKNHKYILTDLSGNVIIKPEYYKLSGLDSFFKATAKSAQTQKGILNKHGKIIVPVKYSEVTRAGDFFIAKKNGTGNLNIYTVYKESGEVLFKSQALHDLIYEKNLNAFLLLDRKNNSSVFYAGYVDTSGKSNRIDFGKYKEGILANSQLDQVLRKGNNFGLVDRNGKEILPFEYKDLFVTPGYPDNFFYQESNFLFFFGENLYGVINRQGKIITDPIFEKIGDRLVSNYGDKNEAEHSLIKVQKNGLWGLYDLESNRIVLPIEYDEVAKLRVTVKNNLLIRVVKSNHIGLVNAAGKTVIPIEYDKYRFIFNRKMIAGYKRNQWQAIFDLSGKQHFIYKK